MENGKGPYLLCYDGSQDARHAIEQASKLFGGGPAIVVYAWRPPSTFSIPGRMIGDDHPLATAAAEFDASAAEEASRIVEEGVGIARDSGFDAEAITEKCGRGAWNALAKLAEDRDARAVVVGSRGGSQLREAVLGSVSHGLVNHSTRPVLVTTHPRRMPAETEG
ncbi:MAG: universal stress protein [Solirubrobacterales bacterium]